jgi:dolichyl-phosphate beta-glucosyltransferase
MHLSVVIPSYNGEKEIKDTLFAVRDYLAKQSYSWEILVVNDGSKDKLREVVLGLANEVPNLKFLDNAVNNGKGYVVRQGMLQANGDFRLFMDDDNSTTVDQLENFWPYTQQGYDVVIGSIEVAGATIKENAQWYRRTLGHFSKYVIRTLGGLWEIKDSQRGFKLFSAKAVNDIFPRTRINRFGFDIEVLNLAKRLGYKTKEVPVVWNNAGGSSVNLKSYVAVFMDLLNVRWNLLIGKYNLKKQI